MNASNETIKQLVSIRSRYGKVITAEKTALLNAIAVNTLKNKKLIQDCYSALLFLAAYPDNNTVYKLANGLLLQLQQKIAADEDIQYNLYNTGITGTTICAAFSFELVKWLHKTMPGQVRLNSFEAGDAQIQSILSVVMSKAESEILQDANAEWKGWLKQLQKPGKNLLGQFLDIFESSNIRPEVKDELWNAIGINVEIDCRPHCCLPGSLTTLYYHRSLIKKQVHEKINASQLKPVKLTTNEAEQLIACSRLILVRKLRELDPISFTDAKLVSYYRLSRGIAVALMGMVPERRHPIDSYMGYLVFKNGLPVAYAGSWILFDSARIGLNVFADYRGGESKYIFDQVLQLHAKVYRLKRFTVDPYQIGKENSDGIHSGAFWIYYHAGFRPVQKKQLLLATTEAMKIASGKNYRSPEPVLKILADSRMELMTGKTAVRFDATDLSRVYADLLEKKFNGSRSLAEKDSAKKVAGILQTRILPGNKNRPDEKMQFILKSWSVLLLGHEKELRNNSRLKKNLKKLFILKASGSEEAYIRGLQQDVELRRFMQMLINEYITV